jgi:hypothetical protein
MCPYVNRDGPFESTKFQFSCQGVAEAVASAALTHLNHLKLANEPSMAYLKRKIALAQGMDFSFPEFVLC